MALAAIARLSRRHLPAVATRSGLGGARASAFVHELGRIPSPAPSHHAGRLLPTHLRDLGGVLPLAHLRQPKRFFGSGRNNAFAACVISPEEHTNTLKEFALFVRFSCHGEGHMATIDELVASAAVLQRDLRVLKRKTYLFMLAIIGSVLALQVMLSLLSRYHKTKKNKVTKYKAKLCKVHDVKIDNKSEALELKKRAAELLVKRASVDKSALPAPSAQN